MLFFSVSPFADIVREKEERDKSSDNKLSSSRMQRMCTFVFLLLIIYFVQITINF